MRPNLRRWVGAEGREERRHSNRVVQRKRKELFRESRNSAIETQIFTGREGKREKEGGSGRETGKEIVMGWGVGQSGESEDCPTPRPSRESLKGGGGENGREEDTEIRTERVGGSETGKDKETEQSFIEKEGVVKSEEGRWEGVKQSVREGGSNSERS